MFNYKKYFEEYCKDNNLELKLSFDMPKGYASANGTFDSETKTVFINANLLESVPDDEKAFYLFHELRHASQYLCPNRFSDLINSSRRYTIMYDGTCYKLINGEWKECKLEGTEEYFTNMYLGQPYEKDANTFAYEQVKSLFGNTSELQELYNFWLPKKPVSDEMYQALYKLIDEKTES